MDKKNSLQEKLQEILSQEKFEELESFKNKKSWKTMDKNDRHLLASLFLLQGEKQLLEDNKNASESFDLATKINPENPEVFFRIATAYGNHDNHLLDLKTAQHYLMQALALKPDYFAALVALGNVYSNLGLINHETDAFSLAQEFFQKAQTFSHLEIEESRGNFYWRWATCYYFQGKLSEEAVDFYAALEKFRLAAEHGIQDKLFWNTYGDALGELACLIGRGELFLNVVELYRNAVRQAFDFFEGWLSLGCAFQRLFDLYLSEDYFHQASECFKMASQINENNSILWLKWAQLNAAAGKLLQDSKLFPDAFEKFSKANDQDTENPLILGLWGESLLFDSARREDLEGLREAQKYIMQSLEINPNSAETWYIYGCCYYELGRYFGLEDYYHQAIDKFQFGLSIKQSEPLLWYGMAIAHYSIGDLRNDIIWLEKANQLFGRVLEFKGHGFRPMWNDWAVTLMKLAELTSEKSYIDEAIEKFEQVIPADIDKDEEQNYDVEWLYNYGCALDFLGDFIEETEPYEKAIQALSKVLQIDPDYNHARYNLALALAHLADLARDVECFHKSIEQFQILLSHDKEDEMGWCDYGATIIHLAHLIHDPIRSDQSQKLYEIAESKLLQAVSLGCTHTYYVLACLYSLQNNFSAALHYLEKSDRSGTLPSLDQILHDEWLQGVRTTSAFRHFITLISAKRLLEED